MAIQLIGIKLIAILQVVKRVPEVGDPDCIEWETWTNKLKVKAVSGKHRQSETSPTVIDLNKASHFHPQRQTQTMKCAYLIFWLHSQNTLISKGFHAQLARISDDKPSYWGMSCFTFPKCQPLF